MEPESAKGEGIQHKQTRRGPAPFASFEDASDESSSPESKLTFQLPHIQEDSGKCNEPTQPEECSVGPRLERGRSLSTPAVQPGHLTTPSTPRIDISRASSSSHHDSRDSSPELALFAGKDKDQSKLELGFREEGALELRSSTEELYFMEPNTAETEKEVPRPPSRRSPLMFGNKIEEKQKHSRKDSQTSDIVLLSISGRTSRLSSIGSQGSAHSNISAQSNISHISLHSHISAQSRLSVISGVSRSPSPHKMLLETSFCGPKPIENEPDVGSDVSEERILEMVGVKTDNSDLVEKNKENTTVTTATTLDSQNNQIKIEVTVENEQSTKISHLRDKRPDVKSEKEKTNQLKVKETKNKPLISTHKSRDPKRPEVYSSKNKNKDIIRIKLKPDSDDEDDESDKTLTNADIVQKPVSLNLHEQSKKAAQNFNELINREEKVSSNQTERRLSAGKKKIAGLLTPSCNPTPSKKQLRKDHDSRTPSPAGLNASRKSSFCSLFKSKDTAVSPDSPSVSTAKRKSANEGPCRSRSKSRDRSTTPTSSGKAKGSVLSLFKTQKKCSTPNSRATSPVVHTSTSKSYSPAPSIVPKNSEHLKYYSESKDGVIHIPLHTPPDEPSSDSPVKTSSRQGELKLDEIITHEEAVKNKQLQNKPQKPTKITTRTVLPDGSIIIPLHSPTEKVSSDSESGDKKEISVCVETHAVEAKRFEVAQPISPITPVASSKEMQNQLHKTVSTMMETIVDEPKRKKEHILFTTSVGSKEHLFSTQFSLTKTPSVTSEYSDLFLPSLESYQESNEDKIRKEPILPETHICTSEQHVIVESRSNNETFATHFEQIFTQPIKETKITNVEDESIQIVKNFKDENMEEAGDSSGSEMSSGMGTLKKKALEDIIAHSAAIEETEKKGLVLTQDSFEDELPYVPTTLPQERSVALPIIPIKERQSTGMRMYPIERPRSTTPINPSCLEEYLSEEPKTPDNPNCEKLKISLPKKDATDIHKNGNGRSKSPRRLSYGSSPKPWAEFAVEGLPNTPGRKQSIQNEEKQPELPPRAPIPKPQWINFEEVPERRKMPKRIQTVPKHSSEESDGVVYNYVNPEDCKCECHESARAEKQEDEEPLLDDGQDHEGLSAPMRSVDRRSLISDSSAESSCGVHASYGHEEHAGLQVGHPFNMDLGVRSNRSSIASPDNPQASDIASPANDALRRF